MLGIGLAPAMLEVAVLAVRYRGALPAVADAARLPLREGVLDAVFAAGLVMRLPVPAAGLREFARVVRPSGAVPSGRPGRPGRPAGAPARPGRSTGRAEPPPLLLTTGRHLTPYTDEGERFLALSVRA